MLEYNAQTDIWIPNRRKLQSASMACRYNSDNVAVVFNIYCYLQYTTSNSKQLNNSIQQSCIMLAASVSVYTALDRCKLRLSTVSGYAMNVPHVTSVHVKQITGTRLHANLFTFVAVEKYLLIQFATIVHKCNFRQF